MTKATRETLWTVAYIIAGLGASGLCRMFLAARRITNFPMLPLIILGLAGGLIYAAVQLRGLSYALMMVVLLFFVQLALTPPLRTVAAIRAALWATPVGLSFIIAGYLFKFLHRIRLGKFLIMALIVGLAHLTVVLLFRFHTGQEFHRNLLTYQFIIGALFGTLFGILIEIIELIFPNRVEKSSFDLPTS
jgi:hypothetical protein